MQRSGDSPTLEALWQDSDETAVRASRLKRVRNLVGRSVNRVGLKTRDITILSNDCWGHQFYRELGLPVRTPFIGAGMHADCFLRFLTDARGYLRETLRFVPNSRYRCIPRLQRIRRPWPIAMLGDVEVHFLHWQDAEAAAWVWNRGLSQANLDHLAVAFTTDKDGADTKHMATFAAMPYTRKLLLSAHAHPELPCAVAVPDYLINGAMMFRRSIKYFDCPHWLNTGQIVRGGLRVRANKILYARGA